MAGILAKFRIKVMNKMQGFEAQLPVLQPMAHSVYIVRDLAPILSR